MKFLMGIWWGGGVVQDWFDGRKEEVRGVSSLVMCLMTGGGKAVVFGLEELQGEPTDAP